MTRLEADAINREHLGRAPRVRSAGMILKRCCAPPCVSIAGRRSSSETARQCSICLPLVSRGSLQIKRCRRKAGRRGTPRSLGSSARALLTRRWTVATRATATGCGCSPEPIPRSTRRLVGRYRRSARACRPRSRDWQHERASTRTAATEQRASGAGALLPCTPPLGARASLLGGWMREEQDRVCTRPDWHRRRGRDEAV